MRFLLAHILGHKVGGRGGGRLRAHGAGSDADLDARQMCISERGDVPAVVALRQQLPRVDDYSGSAELSTVSGE